MPRKPKSIWIILDPLDGPHLFISKTAAWKTYMKWEKEAKDYTHDSFWDMSEPIRYDLGLPTPPKKKMSFREHCKWSSEVIKTWPKWKRDAAKTLFENN